MADLIDRYTEHVLPDLPASARDYARHLRWWKDKLGSSPRLIDDCKQKLLREPGPKGKRSNATVNRYLTTLSAVYTYGMSPAVSWVTQHVVRTVGRKEEPRGRVRFFSRPVDEQDSELERLKAHIPREVALVGGYALLDSPVIPFLEKLGYIPGKQYL